MNIDTPNEPCPESTVLKECDNLCNISLNLPIPISSNNEETSNNSYLELFISFNTKLNFYNLAEGDCDISIYNNLGQRILHKCYFLEHNANTLFIDTNNLLKNTLYLVIVFNGKETQIKKLLIN